MSIREKLLEIIQGWNSEHIGDDTLTISEDFSDYAAEALRDAIHSAIED